MGEQSLLCLVVKKDPEALKKLYDDYAPKLFSLCLRYMGNRADAEDVLHDGFIKILENLPGFRMGPACNLEGWMKKIMVNTALNDLRQRAKEEKLISFDKAEGKMGVHDEEFSEEDAFPVIPEKEVILEMIGNLPAGYRTVFNLYVFEEYSHREIAVMLGCSEGTSKSQLSKARVMLRHSLTSVFEKEKRY